MNQLRPHVVAIADQKCREYDCTILSKLIDVKGGEKMILLGTLYKEMPLKPCILDEITEEVVLRALRIDPDTD